MRFEQTIKLSKEETEFVERVLTVEPTNEDECMGEDETFTKTVKFENGVEMDIKICGVQYNEDEASNLPWTEAVLFRNNSEVCCSEPEIDFLGEWILEDDDDEYVVVIEKS